MSERIGAWLTYVREVLNRITGRFFLDTPIRTKLVVIAGIVTLVPVTGLGVVHYLISKARLLETENAAVVSSVRQVQDYLDYHFETVLIKSDVLVQNRRLIQLLQMHPGRPLDRAMLIEEVHSILRPVVFGFNGPMYPYGIVPTAYETSSEVTVYTANPAVFSLGDGIHGVGFRSSEGLTSEPWYTQTVGREHSVTWLAAPGSGTSRRDQAVLFRRLVDFRTGESIGAVRLSIPLESISRVLRGGSFRDGWVLALVSGDGRLVAGTDPDTFIPDVLPFLRQQFSEAAGEPSDTARLVHHGTEYVAYGTTSRITGWSVFAAAPYDHLTALIGSLRLTATWFTAAAFLVALGLMSILSRSLLDRLAKLADKIDRAAADTGTELQPIGGNDELGRLDCRFNTMVDRINDLIHTEYELRLNAKMIEAELLQEQLNPHLLYNSLSALRWTAREAGEHRIHGLTDRLIRFLKSILSDGRLVVPVLQEIAIVEDYFALCRDVYGLQCALCTEVDPHLGDSYCIKLILQPVVENAVMHGLRPLKTPGKLMIRACRHDRQVVFTVDDNGIGFDSATMDDPRYRSGDEGHGFGIRNLKRRIELAYGTTNAVEIASKPGEGTSVTVRIPLTTQSQAEGFEHRVRRLE